MMRVFQSSSIARALSVSNRAAAIIHQATGAPKSMKFSWLQEEGRLLSYHLRKTQGEPFVFKISADKALRYFGLTPPQRYVEFNYIPIPLPTMSQITSFAEWLKEHPITVFSPEMCHPTVDRPQEMKKIDKVLEKQSKSVKVLYLVGEPGVGKSQLARKYGVNYAERISTSSKTVLTLDMSDFRANYCKLAMKLGLSHSVINSQSLSTVAEEMKKSLSTRNYWMLIIDNYNSTDYEGFERDLLPLHGSTGEWGSGTVLVTTNNASVVPIITSHTSKVTIDPLSMEECLKLIGQTAGYTLDSGEEALLKSTVEQRQWRLVPPVMASVGNYIGLRRRQDADNGYTYNLSHYVKELEEGEAMDPEHSNRENVELALRNIIKTSDALRMTFNLLAISPENVKIPLLLFEKLTKKYYQEEWAHKYDEIANCTVLTVEQNTLREVRVQKQYLQAMQMIAISGAAYNMAEEEQLMSTFIDCITETFDHIFKSVIANKRTSLILDSLRQLLMELENSIEGSERFSKDVKMKIQHAWRAYQSIRN